MELNKNTKRLIYRDKKQKVQAIFIPKQLAQMLGFETEVIVSEDGMEAKYAVDIETGLYELFVY